VLIVVDLVRAQDPPQMGLVPDDRAVQELGTASADPAFSAIAFTGGVRTLQSTVRIPASARTASNAAVKFEPAVADHELDPMCLLAEVHQQVSGLLGGPRSGGMQSDSENPDAPAGVLDHGQDISLGAIEKVGCEEVAHHDRLGLGAQEQRPRRPAPPQRGIDARIFQDLPYWRCRDSYPEPGQFSMDPAVAPVAVLAGQPED
jgi:hypothetical protein